MTVEYGGRRLRLIRPCDIDSLIHQARDEDELPFWAYLWPASIGLARYLMEAVAPVERISAPALEPGHDGMSLSPGRSDADARVSPYGAPAQAAGLGPCRALELGAGLGLAGIAAALRGAAVIQTDLSPDALRFARVNALRNGLRLPQFAGDWRRFALRSRFDLVLGSDLLYEPKLHTALASVIRQSLAPGGRVLISDPCRVYGLQFMARLEDAGWRISVRDAPSSPGDETAVLVYKARPPEA